MRGQCFLHSNKMIIRAGLRLTVLREGVVLAVGVKYQKQQDLAWLVGVTGLQSTGLGTDFPRSDLQLNLEVKCVPKEDVHRVPCPNASPYSASAAPGAVRVATSGNAATKDQAVWHSASAPLERGRPLLRPALGDFSPAQCLSTRLVTSQFRSQKIVGRNAILRLCVVLIASQVLAIFQYKVTEMFWFMQ